MEGMKEGRKEGKKEGVILWTKRKAKKDGERSAAVLGHWVNQTSPGKAGQSRRLKHPRAAWGTEPTWKKKPQKIKKPAEKSKKCSKARGKWSAAQSNHMLALEYSIFFSKK